MESLGKANIAELEEIPDIGPVVAGNISKWFSIPENKHLLDRLVEGGLVWPTPAKVIASDDQPSLTCIITGSFPGLSREQLKERLNTRGIRVVTSLSKNVDFLVAGDKAGSKLKKARELGLPILQEIDVKLLLDDEISTGELLSYRQ